MTGVAARLRHQRRTRRGGGRGNQAESGTAIANFETVAEAIPASKIVKMATIISASSTASFNNAGILRDMIFTA